MPVARRFFLTRAAALMSAAVLPLAPLRGWAVTTLTAGGLRIDSVSDGHIEFPSDFAFSMIPEAERGDLLRSLDIDPQAVLRSPLNVTLLRQADRVVLFDVGSGSDFMPTAGTLVDALAAIDVAPEDVTDVIFTHGHPDHLWGVLDDFDEPLFAKAAHRMGEVEFEYWTHPATIDTIGADRQSFAAGAIRRLTALGGRVERFADGAEVLPGIRAVMTPGHTPGHMSFAVGTPAEGLFVTGDFVTMLAGFARPDLGAATDHDPALAARTRRATLARLAEEGWTILGYHLPQGGIGTVARAGDAYAFVLRA
ncbi:MBL fold metallo-hydrolase [Paracoccus sediminis]|uniref:Glyoxylase, beta-lactamase superfamily II n=1 Tax=Paracoccus sediminis TaxID=1214787 RepID=A0A238UUX3_9RHOB|nr:MBL fold metallo-hydrolase [Paracoccus sediminis]TBN52771.1 MBL fold metallo-hydrolase [Paracoccus sediminis]SNR25972.1 Glyoxylase, beta-lactamase superfamily II [Paracoccus sediminis]